ncbi:hypothetical protein [Helicobacter canis]|uniref:hypothetical protein n=1 Tax=Helicobacter canis TaxID=29419 RepID=UPI0015EFEBA6|nr:hypothetical protein [Helicobacter canis]
MDSSLNAYFLSSRAVCQHGVAIHSLHQNPLLKEFDFQSLFYFKKLGLLHKVRFTTARF